MKKPHIAKRIEVEMRWRPFLLNPEASRQGVNKLQMYIDKFGAARVQQMVPMMTRRFADVGLQYSMGGKTGSTVDSHRLSVFALKTAGVDKQNQLMEELFMNYFCEEKFLGDHAVLLAAAEKVGLAGAQEVLGSDAYLEDVMQELDTYATNIRGVPFFIVDNKHKVSGAQPAEFFEELFADIADEAA